MAYFFCVLLRLCYGLCGRTQEQPVPANPHYPLSKLLLEVGETL